MKLASIHRHLTGPSVAIRNDDGTLTDIRDIDTGYPTELVTLLEAGGETLRQLHDRRESTTRRLHDGDFTFRPLIPNPTTMWCAALNYPTHVSEGGWEHPSYPAFFLRSPSSLCAHLEPMTQPRVSDRLDYEGELAVVIGKSARHVPESDAYDVVAGYSCFNDGSVRDWQRHTSQITAGKNFTRTGSFGPWLTTRDEIEDIGQARLTTRLNHVVMQNARISEMIFDIPHLVNYVSTMCQLNPGDVIVTGTPGGVGVRNEPPIFLHPGDEVEVEIEGVGLLSNRVAAERAPND